MPVNRWAEALRGPRVRALAWAVLLIGCGSDTVGPDTPVASVEVSPATAPLPAGTTLQLAATTRDARDRTLTGRTIDWTSSDTGVVVVSTTGLVTGRRVGPAVVTATSEQVSGTAAITVSPGAATQLVFTVQPAGGTAGAPFAPAVEVTARDVAGNTATGFSGDVSVALGANPGNATLAGTLTRPAVAGLVSFDDLRLDKAADGYTLAASATNLSGATSSTFAVGAGAVAADQSSVSAAPDSIPATGAAVSTITVTARDSFGNPVPGASVGLAATGGGNLITQPAAPTDAAGVTSGTLGSTVAETKTISATAGGVALTATASVTVTPGGATRLAFLTQPASTTGGATMGQVQVQVLDSAGNPIPNATSSITLALGNNAKNATLGGTTSQSAVNGVATFPDLTVDSAATGYTLIATSSGLAPDTSVGFTVAVGSAVALGFRVEPGTTAGGATITPAIEIEVRDSGGNRVTSANTAITVGIGTNPSAGTLDGTTTVGAANGIASFSTLSIDSVGTGYTLTAAGGGLAGATSTPFDVVLGGAARLGFAVQPGNTSGGATITPAVQVEVQDSGGNRITGATTAITLALATNPGNAHLGGTTTQSAVNGVATFPDLSIDSAAPGYTLVATAGGLAGATSNPFAVTVGPATQLAFLVQPGNTASGAAISPAVEVEIRDAGGNRVTSASHTITLAIQDNPGGATLGGTTARAAVNGLATFGDLTLDKAGTGYTLRSTAVPSLTPATSVPFAITSGAADHLAFLVEPSDATAGAAISPAVQVEILDAAGNLLTNDTRTVTLAILDNPGGGTLAGTSTVAATAGVATFPSLSIDAAGTSYTLQATSSPALTAAVSAEFNIAPAAPSQAAFFVQPSDAVAGAAITPGVQVEILDTFGNRVGTATNSVTVALAANPGSGTLSGPTTSAAVAGVATFADLSIDRTGSGYTLAAASSGLSPDTSGAFAIAPGTATQLVFTEQPATTAAGTVFAPALQVTARDGVGNTDTAFSGTITVAIGSPGGGGTLSGTTSVPAVQGVATFSDLSIDKIGTGYSLTATAVGPAAATSGFFDITLGSAAQLAFLTPPSNTTGGATISPAVQVVVRDAGGNLVDTATNSVTLAIVTNPSSGSLSGTQTVAAVGGVATFNDLSIDSAGTGYTLSATASGLSGAGSDPFDVAVGPAAQVGFLVQPSNTVPGAQIAPAVEVEVRDAGGNRVIAPDTTVSLVIGNNPSSGTLSGTTAVVSSGGVATFADLSIDQEGNDYTLVATATGLSGATSTPFNIQVGTAAQLAFVTQPSNTTGGVTISPAVQVEIQDVGGNRVDSATISVTLAIAPNPSGGSLSGKKTVAAVSGVATFSNLSVDSAGSGYTLAGTASGLMGATSASFEVTVGPPAKVGFRVQPSDTTGGAPLAPAVEVEVRDAGGNRVDTATNMIAVGIAANPNAGTLSGTTTGSAVGGVATFGDLSIDSAGTGYRLSAAASGLAGATSSRFDITVGPAAQLGFLVQPSDVSAGQAIAPAVAVEVRDAGGNRVTAASNNVTVAIGTNPSGGTLSGTQSISATSGVATFATLSIDSVGIGYTLQAASAGLQNGTSVAFNVLADGVDADLSSLAVTADTIGQCRYSCTPGVFASTVTVTARDQFGNVVAEAPVTLSAGGAGSLFSPSASGLTDGAGTFTASFTDSVFGTKTISATAAGTAISQTASVAVMPVLVGAGDIADCNSTRDDATANQLDSIPGTVFADGDNAYPNGTAANFSQCYDPTWGRHKARTLFPVVGNHEYDSSGTAAGHFDYFTRAVADPEGNGYGYFSRDLGTWHIVVLNSDSGVTSPSSSQLTWLQNDLSGHTNQCVLALWHRPLFTSGSSNGGSTRIRRLWQALEDAGAEVVINGHDHLYERFAPQDSLGIATPSGIREFIAGTGGGETHSNFVKSPANVEASDENDFSRGVLRLVLYATGYRWEFLHAQGQGTYTDSGTASCH